MPAKILWLWGLPDGQTEASQQVQDASLACPVHWWGHPDSWVSACQEDLHHSQQADVCIVNHFHLPTHILPSQCSGLGQTVMTQLLLLHNPVVCLRVERESCQTSCDLTQVEMDCHVLHPKCWKWRWWSSGLVEANIHYSLQVCRELNPWPCMCKTKIWVPPGHRSGFVAVSVLCDIKICSPWRVS